MKPYNIDIKDNTKDVNSVAKSDTPHVLTQQLKGLDPTSPGKSALTTHFFYKQLQFRVEPRVSIQIPKVTMKLLSTIFT